MEKVLQVGVIASTHGIKGEVKVFPTTNDAERFRKLKKVILDTSGALLEDGIKAKPTMIKPNLDEIRMLTGTSCESLEEMIEAAKEIHQNGVEIVAVSLGAEGSFVVCDQGIYQAKVPKVPQC